MVNNGDFLEATQRELTEEELQGLTSYRARADRGSVSFLPIVRGMGQQVQWTARVHIKGAIGPVPVSQASLSAIGAPEDWTEKSVMFLDTLQRKYASLTPRFPDNGLPPGTA